jgi:hypothetical protein
MPVTVQNCCGSGCFAGRGQFIDLESDAKAGHAFNCSSLLACGSTTLPDALNLGISLFNLSATFQSVNSTHCSVSKIGAAFGSLYAHGSFSSLYLTVWNCSGVSIITVLDNSAQATVSRSNFFCNSVEASSVWACGVLTADSIYVLAGPVAGMAVTDCIFYGSSPPGCSLVRYEFQNVEKFVVVNCIFSDSLPSAGNASMMGNIAKS